MKKLLLKSFTDSIQPRLSVLNDEEETIATLILQITPLFLLKTVKGLKKAMFWQDLLNCRIFVLTGGS